VPLQLGDGGRAGLLVPGGVEPEPVPEADAAVALGPEVRPGAGEGEVDVGDGRAEHGRSEPARPGYPSPGTALRSSEQAIVPAAIAAIACLTISYDGFFVPSAQRRPDCQPRRSRSSLSWKLKNAPTAGWQYASSSASRIWLDWSRLVEVVTSR